MNGILSQSCRSAKSRHMLGRGVQRDSRQVEHAETRALVSADAAAYNAERLGNWRDLLQLDDHLKRLLRELGHAINDTVSESERITEAISGVRAAGYDIVLKLDATIGLARREQSSGLITSNDRRFLESLHIQVDQDVLDEEKHETKLEITPQDLRFLKSLKISFDEPKQERS